jgi:hypothetical protein
VFRIFVPKREEVAGGSRRLHNEERHNFYASPSAIRFIKSMRMIRAGHVARMRNAYKSMVGEPESKLRGRPRRR